MPQAKQERIGLFPLSLVVLPKEQTRLHIFEPRYKQLVNDCFARGLDFGIPAVIEQSPRKLGTRVKLVDIERFYPDGKMDILVEGVSVFKLNSFSNQLENKLYSGGEIISLEREDRYQKTPELIHLFNEYSWRTGTLSEDQSYDLNFGIFEMAASLQLNNEEKYNLIATNSRQTQQAILLNHLRLTRALYQQEDDLNHQFYLN